MEALEPDVLAALRRYDTPTMANAIETFDIRPHDTGYAGHEIRCIFPDLPVMVGYVATGTIRARGDEPGHGPDLVWNHVRQIPGPRVVVLQDLDDPPGHGAFWGEVMATTFDALGCEGVVTNGCVRDLDEAHAVGFRFFAGSVGVSHGYVRAEEVGVPVTVGGLQVSPGDLLHADKHGVLLIPREIAADLPAAAERVIAREQNFLGWVKSPEFDPDDNMIGRLRH
ncbi:RraA family protein [Saccharopolyspora spinosa]|uniref:Putative 4-hydroxy-4-methyl-2-oxoglutarate aldolase n=1 Tax=Saccharopolyspora spinosa TaxID=60894 RepID=A0A2N3XVB8_SACSN|nr:RraA family protein [Saccharopolyspora spinosa]PKW14623.1 regulator of RNase E activity RraA [Saccharopolyspora spinosa]